jgi:hypothetical protein
MKDTLVDQFRKHFKSPLFQVFHEGKPPSGVDQKKWAVEHYSFMLRNAFTHQHSSISVYNRSHLGEVVWGPKYRGYNADFIFDLENHFLSSMDDAYLILLTDSAARLMARDDGKSLTKSITELDDVRREFIHAFDKSCIKNKIHIRLEEVAFEDVFNIVLNFVNQGTDNAKCE